MHVWYIFGKIKLHLWMIRICLSQMQKKYSNSIISYHFQSILYGWFGQFIRHYLPCLPSGCAPGFVPYTFKAWLRSESLCRVGREGTETNLRTRRYTSANKYYPAHLRHSLNTQHHSLLERSTLAPFTGRFLTMIYYCSLGEVHL